MVVIVPNESQAATKSIGNKRPEYIYQKTSRGRTTHSIIWTQNQHGQGWGEWTLCWWEGKKKTKRDEKDKGNL